MSGARRLKQAEEAKKNNNKPFKFVVCVALSTVDAMQEGPTTINK